MMTMMSNFILALFVNLYVSGSNALRKSSITTQSSINDKSINSSVILDILGTNNYTYNVICLFGDECFIYCRSYTSFVHMILQCDGMCYIDCGNVSTWSSSSSSSNFSNNYIYDDCNYTQCAHDISGNYL